MKKNKELFEPIRRGAPSLPFDFTEALKKIEVEYSYPKEIEENDFRKTPIYKIKRYCFDYIKEDVMKCYGYNNENSVKTRIGRLKKDNQIEIITDGEDQGKYRKKQKMVM